MNVNYRSKAMRYWAAVSIAVALAACSGPNAEKAASAPPARTMKALADATTGQFQPVPLPDPQVAGYKFPEAETTIVGWTKDNNQKAINTHAWGIWTALTLGSDQSFDGQKLLVFETWYDPQDLLTPSPNLAAARTIVRQPRRLQAPRQFGHGNRSNLLTESTHGEQTVTAFVKYDPSASEHILKNNLLSIAQLTTLLNTDHKTSVPDFPFTGVSLKPVFQPLAANKLVNGRYFRLMTWPGSPELTFDKTNQIWRSKAFPLKDWGLCVWIDTQDIARKPGTDADKTCAADGSSRKDSNTYGVDQFIHFRLSQADAELANAAAKKVQPTSTAVTKQGDYSVLVAMHVTSREITRWTWQTFWWTYLPDKPTAPSSPVIAAERPPQLKGAPRNYAHCTAYEEVSPPQPNSGGSNTGESVYCFNPYLEAPFDPSVLPDSQPGMTMLNGKLVKTANDVGAQTNCMSCHEQANFNPNKVSPAPDYTGDRYVDLNGPAFNGVLKVDFLWSIPGNAQ